MKTRTIQSLRLVLMLTITGSAFSNSIVHAGSDSSEAGSNNVQSTDTYYTSYPGLRSQAFDVGPEIYSYSYEESGFMEEEGVLFGIRLGYTDRDWVSKSQQATPSDGGRMMRGEVRLAYGQVDYDGQTMAGIPYAADNIDDWAFETRFLLGGDWLTNTALNTLYAGIGYRYLLDKLSDDPAGYDRESNYLYVPVGFQWDSSCQHGWSLGFNAEFDVFIVGVQTSHLSDIGWFEDVDNVQESGYGYRASLKLQHKSQKGILILEPFFRYWDIDRSEIEYEFFGPVWEPANETTEIGFSAIWMF